MKPRRRYKPRLIPKPFPTYGECWFKWNLRVTDKVFKDWESGLIKAIEDHARRKAAERWEEYVPPRVVTACKMPPWAG